MTITKNTTNHPGWNCMPDRIQGLERLARLLDEGKLPRNEYEALKQEIIGSVGRIRSAESGLKEDRPATGNRAFTDSGGPILGEPGSPMMRSLAGVEGRLDSLEIKKNVTVVLLWASLFYWAMEFLVAVDVFLPSPFFLGIEGPSLMLNLGRWYPLLLLATGSSFLVWSYGAHANLRNLGRSGIRYADHATIWWWLVPVANLYMPYRVNFETVRGTLARPDDERWQSHALPAFATWWSYSFVTGISLNAVSSYLLATGFSFTTGTGAIHLLGPLFLSFSAFGHVLGSL